MESGDKLGSSINLHKDENNTYVFVGSPGSDNNQGDLKIYKIPNDSSNTSNWTQIALIEGDDQGDLFGTSLEFSINSSSEKPDHLIVGSPNNDDNGNNSGIAKVFEINLGLTSEPTLVKFNYSDYYEDNINNIQEVVKPHTNFEIEFDQEVYPLNGNISIIRAFDQKVIEAIDIWSDQISGNYKGELEDKDGSDWISDGAANLNIYPSEDLDIGINYFIRIDPNALANINGNLFAGVNNETYSFRAEDRTAPLSTITTETSGSDAGSSNGKTKIDSDITLTFSEEVFLGDDPSIKIIEIGNSSEIVVDLESISKSGSIITIIHQ